MSITQRDQILFPLEGHEPVIKIAIGERSIIKGHRSTNDHAGYMQFVTAATSLALIWRCQRFDDDILLEQNDLIARNLVAGEMPDVVTAAGDYGAGAFQGVEQPLTPWLLTLAIALLFGEVWLRQVRRR